MALFELPPYTFDTNSDKFWNEPNGKEKTFDVKHWIISNGQLICEKMNMKKIICIDSKVVLHEFLVNSHSFTIIQQFTLKANGSHCMKFILFAYAQCPDVVALMRLL